MDLQACFVPVRQYVVPLHCREFSGRVGCGWDAILRKPARSRDCHGHGTHVTGIAAGSSYGVAPGAVVHAVRVVDCEGRGRASDLLVGLHWVLEQQEKVHSKTKERAVANVSLVSFKGSHQWRRC
jgi:subtilisin family serine protease